MGSISFELELDELQLVFLVDGKRITADVSGTEENPIMMKFDSLPGFEEVRVDQMFDAILANISMPHKDKVTITINAARIEKPEIINNPSA
jgi:hypothetical protein